MTPQPSPMPPQPDGAPSDGLPPLSPSRANDFKSCPLKFRFRVIDRLPEPPSPAATRGTLVHSVLERLFDKPPPQRTITAAAEDLTAVWSTMVARQPDLAEVVPQHEFDEWFATARELTERYFSLEDPRRFAPAYREMRVEVTLEPGIPTRGFIDRVDESPDGLVRIVDYKTGRSPAPAYVDAALFQLKFYALMLYRLRGVVAARLRLIYLGDGQLVEYTPDLPGLRAFEASLARLWESMCQSARTGTFLPRRSKLCNWCSFQAWCPEFGGVPPDYPHPTAPLPQPPPAG